jgi:hypothetical protein
MPEGARIFLQLETAEKGQESQGLISPSAIFKVDHHVGP